MPPRSHEQISAVGGHTAEGRSPEPAGTRQEDLATREIPRPSPMFEVEQQSQDTSSAIIYTPPLLPRDKIRPSPYSNVVLDTESQQKNQTQSNSFPRLHNLRHFLQNPSTVILETFSHDVTLSPVEKVLLCRFT